MGTIPRISDAEWEIMKILWSGSPRTANEIVDELRGRVSWQPKTVKTMLNRLLKKGAVAYERRERTYDYYPLVSRDECVKIESRSFLERVYDGELDLLVAGFLKEKRLSEEDLARLRRILDEEGR